MKPNSYDPFTFDPYFKLEVLRCTPNPQQLIWLAMHQDYSSEYVIEGIYRTPSEDSCGDYVVEHLLKGGKGHYGPLEHPQITFAAGYFPHSVVQQLRTHRVGISFDVQSFRYTSNSVLDAYSRNYGKEIEKAIYLRPPGRYKDRRGKDFEYTPEMREDDIKIILLALDKYYHSIREGMPEEQARGLLPFDYRQHFIVSFNVRSLMHVLDLRASLAAQLECQVFCDFLMKEFLGWCPKVAEWYQQHRWKKAKLAP